MDAFKEHVVIEDLQSMSPKCVPEKRVHQIDNYSPIETRAKADNSVYQVKSSSTASLINDFVYLHEQPESGDVLIWLDNETRCMYVHRFVLIARSKWFRKAYKKLTKDFNPALLNKPGQDSEDISILVKYSTTESDYSTKDCINLLVENTNEAAVKELSKINDFFSFVEIKIFNLLIFLVKYLYTANCDITNKNIIDLWRCSLAFEVSPLTRSICEYLIDSLEQFSIIEVICIYSLTDKHECLELQRNCIDLINANAKIVILTEEWRQLAKAKPTLVIKAFYKRENF